MLNDKEKRRRYDMGQDVDGQDMGDFSGAGLNPFDIFRSFFAGGGMGGMPEDDSTSDNGGYSSFGQNAGPGQFSFGGLPGFSSFGGAHGGQGRPGGPRYVFKFG